MNSHIRRAALAVTLVFAGSALAAELETAEQKLGYIIGMDVGNSLKQQGTDVDLDALFQAIRDVYSGQGTAMTPEEANAVREAYIAERQAAAAAEREQLSEKNRVAGEQFLMQKRTEPGVIVTDTGLAYKILEMGDGETPAATDTVRVHYRGTLIDGTEFDSSYSRGEPITFALNQVIPGWTEGVQLMPVGSKFMFWIPPQLAYGPDGAGPIPPNSTLQFEVELLGIE